MLVLGFGKLLAQSEHSGATNLLREIDASRGACSKATPVRTLEGKLSGVMLEITYERVDRRTLATYQDSTGKMSEYVEVLTTSEGSNVVVRTIAARFLPASRVSGVALTIFLSQSENKAAGVGARTTKSRPLTSEEQERVRSLSQKVLRRCMSAS